MIARTCFRTLRRSFASRRRGEMLVVDAHHHYLDPTKPFHAFLASLGAPAYSPESYNAACGDAEIVKTVHVEAMADDGLGEAAWVEVMRAEGRCPRTVAIVANCDLAAPDVKQRLAALAAQPGVKGVRWILDYDGPGDVATHVFTTSHDHGDLLRGERAARFESGFALLADHCLSFDLQCAPVQLPAFAALAKRHPAVKVAVCHLGKPRAIIDEPKLHAAWRQEMRALAALPQVHVKLSMLGYAVPGWFGDSVKEDIVKSLLLELVDLFGPERCMFATNWHINASMSDSDGPTEPAPSIPELVAKFKDFIRDLPEQDQRAILRGTAEAFYRIKDEH